MATTAPAPAESSAPRRSRQRIRVVRRRTKSTSTYSPSRSGSALAAATGSGSGSGSGSASGRVGSTPPTLLHTLNSRYGPVVLNASGLAIYVFTADSPGHSACTGSCLTYWPPVPAPTEVASVPGVSAKLGSLTRANGAGQLTINGMPVYTYVGDTMAGDTNGEGLDSFGGHWWLVAPDGHAITGAPGTPGSSTASSSAGTRGGYGY